MEAKKCGRPVGYTKDTWKPGTNPGGRIPGGKLKVVNGEIRYVLPDHDKAKPQPQEVSNGQT
jgi:hypothetical protein